MCAVKAPGSHLREAAPEPKVWVGAGERRGTGGAVSAGLQALAAALKQGVEDAHGEGCSAAYIPLDGTRGKLLYYGHAGRRRRPGGALGEKGALFGPNEAGRAAPFYLRWPRMKRVT